MMQPGILSGVRIMLVDDDGNQLTAFAHIYILLGADVVTAPESAPAIGLLRRRYAQGWVPHVAIIDWHMQQPGADLARVLRDDSRFRDILRVSYSGAADISERAKTLENGLFHLLMEKGKRPYDQAQVMLDELTRRKLIVP